MTSITDQMKAWPDTPTYPIEHPDNVEPYKTNRILAAVTQERDALQARLRTTAEALREALDDFVRIPYGAGYEDVAAVRDFEERARAVLARLEQEGLA